MSDNQKKKRTRSKITNMNVETAENIVTPIDVIDLTVDSPINKIYKVRSVINKRSHDVINLDDSELNKSINNSGRPTCPVCYEELIDLLEPMATRCGHIYCKRCLVECLKHRKSCPKCQRPVSEKTCTRLYF